MENPKTCIARVKSALQKSKIIIRHNFWTVCPRDLCLIFLEMAENFPKDGGDTSPLSWWFRRPCLTLIKQKNGKLVPVVRVGGFTKYLGQMNLTFNDLGELTSFDGNPILLHQNFTEVCTKDKWYSNCNNKFWRISNHTKESDNNGRYSENIAIQKFCLHGWTWRKHTVQNLWKICQIITFSQRRQWQLLIFFRNTYNNWSLQECKWAKNCYVTSKIKFWLLLTVGYYQKLQSLNESVFGQRKRWISRNIQRKIELWNWRFETEMLKEYIEQKCPSVFEKIKRVKVDCNSFPRTSDQKIDHKIEDTVTYQCTPYDNPDCKPSICTLISVALFGIFVFLMFKYIS